MPLFYIISALYLIFCHFFTYRSISIPSVNRAVAKVTDGGQTTRSRSCSDQTPLGTHPPKEVTAQVPKEVKPNISDELAVVLCKHDQEICKPKKAPTTKRAKKLARPHHQDDCKTLAEIKKLKAGQSNVTVDLTDTQNVIEDCHVLTDETDYADWLIQQGIDANVPLPDNFDDADPICKLQHQDTMSIEDLKPAMNEMDKEMATQENKKEHMEVKSKITDTKEEYLTDAEGKKIREDYLGQFQSDLNSFIWSGSSEEETIACIERLRNILDLMGEQSKEKAQKEDSQNLCKNDKEDEKKKTVETDCKIEETQTKPKHKIQIKQT